MAAGLGFKTFTTGEVLTAADTNGYLMQGVLVFASAAARDAAITSPQEGQFAYLKDTNVTTYYTGSAWTNLDTTGMVNPMTTTGDTIYSSSGSTPARLGIGSTGQVLTVAGGVPSWASPAGGGKVLQVKNFIYTTEVTSNNNTLVTTGLTLDITPTSASSKILVMVSIQGGKYDQNTYFNLQLRRGATSLADFGGVACYTNSTAYCAFASGINYLDSPATTSATTYVVYFASGANTANAKINWTAGVGSAASSITLLEIGA